jgi:hypothetical protein
VIPLNTWTKLAAVFDETNGRVKIVVNDVVEDDQAMGTGSNTMSVISIGRKRMAAGSYCHVMYQASDKDA